MQNKGNLDVESAPTPTSSVGGLTLSQKTTDNSVINERKPDNISLKKVDDIVGPG